MRDSCESTARTANTERSTVASVDARGFFCSHTRNAASDARNKISLWNPAWGLSNCAENVAGDSNRASTQMFIDDRHASWKTENRNHKKSEIKKTATIVAGGTWN